MLLNSSTDLTRLSSALEKIIAVAPANEPADSGAEESIGYEAGQSRAYWDVAQEIRAALG